MLQMGFVQTHKPVAGKQYLPIEKLITNVLFRIVANVNARIFYWFVVYSFARHLRG